VTVAKTSVIDCTDPAVLDAASPGARCADGSVYAGALAGKYLITTAAGCGHEPGGTASTEPAAEFTPVCTGGEDTTFKRWSSSTGTIEGTSSLMEGRLRAPAPRNYRG
jgi:hypothetical protein